MIKKYIWSKLRQSLVKVKSRTILFYCLAIYFSLGLMLDERILLAGWKMLFRTWWQVTLLICHGPLTLVARASSSSRLQPVHFIIKRHNKLRMWRKQTKIGTNISYCLKLFCTVCCNLPYFVLAAYTTGMNGNSALCGAALTGPLSSLRLRFPLLAKESNCSPILFPDYSH